jgi:hypothetical protein
MSEIGRALKALQSMVAKSGLENVPLGNEKLRPLLLVMRDVANRHRNEVVVFEVDNDGPRLSDKLRLGLIVRSGEYLAYKREIDEAMSEEVVAAVKANDKRMIAMTIGPTVVVYHEELWIPAAVLLPERRH